MIQSIKPVIDYAFLHHIVIMCQEIRHHMLTLLWPSNIIPEYGRMIFVYQLFHLVVRIVCILKSRAGISEIVLFFENRIIGKLPVDQPGIIKSHFQSFTAHSICQLSCDISLRTKFFTVEICIFTGIQAETIMMLCCQHNIFCPCFAEKFRPLLWLPVLSLPHWQEIFIGKILAIFLNVMFIRRSFSNIYGIIIPLRIGIVAEPFFIGLHCAKLPCSWCESRN